MLVRCSPGACAWPFGLRVFARCLGRWEAGDDPYAQLESYRLPVPASDQRWFLVCSTCLYSWCPGLVDLRDASPCRRMRVACSVMHSACARGIMLSALVVRRQAFYRLVWGGFRAKADVQSIGWRLACCRDLCGSLPCSLQQWACNMLGLACACRGPPSI